MIRYCVVLVISQDVIYNTVLVRLPLFDIHYQDWSVLQNSDVPHKNTLLMCIVRL